MPLYLKDKLVSGTGAQGSPGKSAYQTAVEAGYRGTEAAFNQTLTNVPVHITDTENPHGVTATQTGAYTKGETDTLLHKKVDKDRAVNPNLLDNWYFGNPVNQRQGRIVVPNTTYYSDNTLTTSAGTTSAYVTAYRYATGTANDVNYASFKLTDSDTAPTYYAAPENVVRGYTGAGYGIDRWKVTGNSTRTILVEDDGVKFIGGGTDNFLQVLDGAKVHRGKTFTLSILVSEFSSPSPLKLRIRYGNYAIVSETSITGTGLFSVTGTFNTTTEMHPMVTISNSDDNKNIDLKIQAAKLELGTHQTLAHQENGNWVLNEIPDYGEQLARCQRVLLPVEAWKCYSGRIDNDGNAFIEIPTPVSMRSGDLPVIVGAKSGLVYHASGLKDVTYSVASLGANSVTIPASGIGVTNQVCSGCFANKVFLSREL